MKELLLIIDMQNDFIDGSLGTKEAQAIVPLVAMRAAAARHIIFTQDTHGEDYLTTQEGKKLPVRHCIKPEQGWEICAELQPYVNAHNVLEKPTFGCTKLVQVVEDYDKITLTGLCTDICVISNALLLKAAMPEVVIKVDPTCCAGVTPEKHKAALAVMSSCQIAIE